MRSDCIGEECRGVKPGVLRIQMCLKNCGAKMRAAGSKCSDRYLSEHGRWGKPAKESALEGPEAGELGKVIHRIPIKSEL